MNFIQLNIINCLLLYFLEDMYFLERKDKDTIIRFIKDMLSEAINRTISQGKEILQLKEFPYEFIRKVSNRRPTVKQMNPTEKDYCDWVKWMVKELEKEAKKNNESFNILRIRTYV